MELSVLDLHGLIWSAAAAWYVSNGFIHAYKSVGEKEESES